MDRSGFSIFAVPQGSFANPLLFRGSRSHLFQTPTSFLFQNFWIRFLIRFRGQAKFLTSANFLSYRC